MDKKIKIAKIIKQNEGINNNLQNTFFCIYM